MESGRQGIGTVSIHFVSGVAIAASLPWGETFFRWAAALGCIALGLLWLLMRGRGGRLPATMAALVLAGFFCYCCARACTPLSSAPAWTVAALGKFTDAIDACGLKHEGSTALLKALLAGKRDGLDSGTLEAFRRSGASHLLALSGLHLGVIYLIIRRLLFIIGNSRPARLTRSLLAVGLCTAYSAMTGFGASVTRALLFIVLHECGTLLPGRRHSLAGTFCTAITIQLAASPRSIETLSFQLSYLAMLGIVGIAPALRSFYPGDGRRRGPVKRIWDSAALSVSCQITTAPLAWISFGSLPRHFLLTNLVALPLTELLIVVSLPMTALDAAGACPEMLKGLSDFLAQALVWCLEVVSSM